MTVYLVGRGPGRSRLLTVAAPSCSRRPTSSSTTGSRSPALLELAPADAELVDVGKAPGQRRHDAGRDQRAARRARPRRAPRSCA